MADFIRIHTTGDKKCRLLNVEQIERIDEHISDTRILAKICMLNGDWFVSDESFCDICDALLQVAKMAFKPADPDELWEKLMQKID